MARLTKEQIVSKLEKLNKQLSKLDSNLEKELSKVEKDLANELKKVPYLVTPLVGQPYTVTKEDVIQQSELLKSSLLDDYDWSVKKCRENINSLTNALSTIEEDVSIMNAAYPSESLINAFRKVVAGWIKDEQRDANSNKFYSLLSESELENDIILPMAQGVSTRAYPVIGNVASFSEPQFRNGNVDIYCSNAKGDTCHLTTVFVHSHTRDCGAKTVSVHHHFRTIVTK